MKRQSEQRDDFPWWLVVLIVGVGWALFQLRDHALYLQVFQTLTKGIGITVFVTLVAFVMACILGMVLAVMMRARWQILRQIARGYVEVVRGVPVLVLLLYVAFVLAPALVWVWNQAAEVLDLSPARTRDFSMLWRAVIALTLGYSAFLAEVFRAGLQSVDTGQIEAAEALGLTRAQQFRLIILPQATRVILPPLGNDFVAMVKDSSLVSVLGVLDITQLGKLTAAGNFRYFETYNVVALIYLTMTIGLSLVLRRFEKRLQNRP